MPSTRSGCTAERQCASIMIATACSIGWPSPRRTARLTACTTVGELLAIFSAMRCAAGSSSSCGRISLTMPSRYASCAVIGSPVMSICSALPGGRTRGSSAGEPPPAASPIIASGWPKVAFWEARMKSVLCAIGAAAVRDSVDRGEDRFAQLAQRVERAVEVLPLAQPLLLGHALALPQVAADREGAGACAGQDRHADRRAHGDGLQHLGQPGAHRGGDRVVGPRTIEGDHRDGTVRRVVEKYRLTRIRVVGNGWPEVQRL